MSKKEKTWTSVPANAFGGGHELIGLTCRGKKITMATRKYMFLEDGQKIERKGNRVEFNPQEMTTPYRQVVKIIS